MQGFDIKNYFLTTAFLSIVPQKAMEFFEAKFLKYMRSILTLFSLFLLSSGIFRLQAQETWSLEACIDYARLNSWSIKQAEYGILDAKLNQKQSKFNRLPSVSGGINAGFQFGRTIDPTTNQFYNQRIGFNSYNISGGVNVFNASRVNNTIKQSNLNVKATEKDAEKALNDLGFQIAAAYLNILLAEEQLVNARQRLELSEEQLEVVDKQIAARVIPENSRLDILAQIARDQQGIIEANNALEINYLSLKQLLNLDPNTQMRIQKPDLSGIETMDPAAFDLEAVFQTALKTQPQIQAAELREQMSGLDIKIAKSALAPSLRIFGGLSNNYSDQAIEVVDYISDISTQTIYLDNNPVQIGFPSQTPIFSKKSFGDQLSQNFGQNLGVSLSIPIYSNSSGRINVERARLSQLNTQAGYQQLRQNLKAEIQNAIASAQAAKNTLDAARLAENAALAAFENTQKRFDLGAVNSFEYTTSRNTLDQARIEAIRARYQFIFNVKTVEFYMGKALTLE